MKLITSQVSGVSKNRALQSMESIFPTLLLEEVKVISISFDIDDRRDNMAGCVITVFIVYEDIEKTDLEDK